MSELGAQWLPDPSGRFEGRYWDGATWTAHVVKDGNQESDPPGDLPPPGAAAKQGLRDRARAVASKATETSSALRERRKPAEPTKASGLRASAQPIESDGAILQLKSHDEGRNATVTLYPDRIERVKERAFGSISRARQDTEVIPTKAIASVQAKKAGVRTHVTIYASGNNIDFRMNHDDAQRFREAITKLIVSDGGAPVPSPAAPVADLADQLRKLAALRDDGILSESEFEAQKAKLLG